MSENQEGQNNDELFASIPEGSGNIKQHTAYPYAVSMFHNIHDIHDKQISF